MSRDHNVYVLGAGMSVESGIPAMNGLTNAILSEKYMGGSTNLLAHFCAFGFPGLDLNMDMDGCVTGGSGLFLNVEQFMSSLDAFRIYSDITGRWKGLSITPERMLPLFLHLVARAVIDLSPSIPLPYFVNFASKLRPGDVVITLNWDCLLEKACDHAGIRWALPEVHSKGESHNAVIRRDVVTIIKLHGSVDWRKMRAGLHYNQILCSADGEPLVVRTDAPLREEVSQIAASRSPRGLVVRQVVPGFGGLPFEIQTAETPFIIPPSHFKSFPDGALPGLLWSCAWDALAEAASVTIIGYSLPLTDYLPRWLLRAGLLFNKVTGKRLFLAYMGCPLDADEATMSRYGLFPPIRQEDIDELRMQALLAGMQDVRRCWDAACIPIDIINPDRQLEEHFKRMVSANIRYHKATAGSYCR